MRILVYSHDTYGLGHLRRSLLIADALGSTGRVSTLIATGSPRAQAFELPRGTDTIKLPAILKQKDGSYRSRDLDLPLHRLIELRARLIVSAWRNFRPDVVLVDHAPVGVEGELLPLFSAMRRQPGRSRLVLGLRDIIDEVDVVKESWERDDVFKIIDRDYDRVFVYGCDSITTTARELGIEEFRDAEGRSKVEHVGYLTRRAAPAAAVAGKPRLLVMAGGGGDGHGMMRQVLNWLEHRREPLPFEVEMVTGPLLSHRRTEEIAQRAAALPVPPKVIEFDPAIESRLAAASAVISMGGYNSVTEILAARVPALILPREEPRREQLLRAQRLEPFTGLRHVRQSEVQPRDFDEFVAGVQSGAIRTVPRLRLDGAERARDRILAMERSPAAAPDSEEPGAGRPARRLAGAIRLRRA